MQAEGLMHRPQRPHTVGLVHQNGNLDVAGGDHAHVDMLGGQGGKHSFRNTRVRAHASADNRHLAHFFLMMQSGA